MRSTETFAQGGKLGAFASIWPPAFAILPLTFEEAAWKRKTRLTYKLSHRVVARIRWDKPIHAGLSTLKVEKTNMLKVFGSQCTVYPFHAWLKSTCSLPHPVLPHKQVAKTRPMSQKSRATPSSLMSLFSLSQTHHAENILGGTVAFLFSPTAHLPSLF